MKLRSRSTRAGGDPNIVIVGLPDTAVKESQDRVTTAISNSGYYWPRGRTTINLAPADIKKEGPSFDLPIALGMIAVARRSRWLHVRAVQLRRRAGAEWRGAAGERRSAGRDRSAAPRQAGVDRPGGECARGLDGRRHRHLRRAESAADLRVHPRRAHAASRRVAI